MDETYIPRLNGRWFDVVGVEVYRSDVVVRRDSLPAPVFERRRGEVTMLTDDSLRRLAFVANNANVEFRSMVTLTYPNECPEVGTLCKRHLGAMLMAFKRKLGPTMAYLWWLEFQRRGAPHFHILLNVGLPGCEASALREWLSATWYRIVQSGDELHLLAGTRWENIREAEGARHYVTKYASKTYQKQVPPGFRRVGRFWGNSRNIKVMPILIAPADEESLKIALADWPFAGVLERDIPRVLFNAARWWCQSG